jgi:hypothetical protein
MRTKRPSLAERMQEVARPEPSPPPATAAGTNREPGTFYAATRAGKKKFTIVLDPAAHRQLRQMALDLDRSSESLAVEAINDLFGKYGKPPIA